MDTKNKVAIVTGAASGIGRETAVLLSRNGARVVVADIDETGGQQTAELIRQEGGKVLFVKTDVSKYEDLEALFRTVEDKFGGVDILHNNAGILPGKPAYPESPRERWERIIAVNLWSVIAATQLAIRLMQKRGGGVIVNTSSLAGLVTYPDDPIYAVSKHGIVGLTRSLGPLGKTMNIRVNAMCPAGVDTPMVSVGVDEMTAEERAQRDAFLARVPLLPPSAIAEQVLRFVEDDGASGQIVLMSPGREGERVPAPISFR